MAFDMFCHLEEWHGLTNMVSEKDEVQVYEALQMREMARKEAVLFAGKKGCTENVLYSIVEYDELLDIVKNVFLFKDTFVSGDVMDELIRKYPNAEFGVIYAKATRSVCEKAWAEEKSKHIGPITLDKANAFVKENHRHHDSVTGCKFAIGLYKIVDGKDVLIGTAICGRPVSRMLDDGYTLEINRLCVAEGETGNGCSMLYGASCRIAKDMGYKKVITYILESESGVSLKASNFQLEDACCGGKNWSGERKRSLGKTPEEMKQRWVKVL